MLRAESKVLGNYFILLVNSKPKVNTSMGNEKDLGYFTLLVARKNKREATGTDWKVGNGDGTLKMEKPNVKNITAKEKKMVNL